MNKKRFLVTMIAFVMVFTTAFASAGAVYGASVNELDAAAQKIEFDKSYSASWTKDTSDKEYCGKIEVSTAGIMGITAVKPADADGNMKLGLMLYNEYGETVWGSDCTYTADKDGDYNFGVGLIPGTYYLTVKMGSKVISGEVSTEYTVSFTENACAEREPNTAQADATVIDPGKTYTAFLGSDGAYNADERDVYTVDLVKGNTYRITIGNYAAVKGSSAMVEMIDADGFGISLNLSMNSAVDSSGNSTYTYKAISTGTYYIILDNYNQAQFEYSVRVDQTSPAAVANLLRVCGNDRFDTAIATAKQLKTVTQKRKFDNVIVAYGLNFPDALSGGYLAGIKDAPILLVSTDAKVESKVAGYIRDNLDKNGTVYILGGNKVVTDRFAGSLKEFNVKRIAGSDRFGTNLAVLNEGAGQKSDLIVCTGMGYADSLSASATGLPMLLVTGSSLTAAQQKYIETLAPENIYVIGGVKAVTPAMETKLAAFGKVTRVSGADRYATSVAVAKTFLPEKCSSAVYAYALNYPDGLSGGPLAMALGAPVVLTDNAKASVADTYSAGAGVQYGVVMGGAGLISDGTMKKILTY